MTFSNTLKDPEIKPTHSYEQQLAYELLQIQKDISKQNDQIKKSQQQQIKITHLIITVALFVGGVVVAYFDGIEKARQHANSKINPLMVRVHELDKKIERILAIVEARKDNVALKSQTLHD